jgi:hypothetical protein
MANNFLNTSELDFASIKSSLKTYLSGQSRFSDYDFEGSNMSVLLDILAYNTYLNNFYVNMVGSEMFLDTAQLRESIVSHAKELNYIPSSRTSAKAVVNVRVTPTDTPSFITIPKFYEFTTTIDNTTLNYSTDADIIIYPGSNGYLASNVSIYEGSVVTEYFTASNTTFYRLQSENIDTNSIDVIVINSQYDSSNSTWLKAENLYGLSSTSNVFFVQGYGSNQYELTFGNDVTGRALVDGNIVKVRYRDTIGDLGNGAYRFSKGASIQGYSNVSVTTVTAAAEGSERESNGSIKFNATRFFTTQERAVTALDYANLAKARFPQLQSVIAYGGEEMTPPQYGKVAVSVKPFGSTGLISQSLKTSIINYLNTKNITTQAVIVDPEYFYVKVDTSVNYNTSATNNSSAQIEALVRSAIISYANNNLIDFGDDLRYSKLIKDIDASEASIISNETQLKIIKRWSPTVGVASSLDFTFDNQLYAESFLYELPQGHDLVVYSGSFTYTHTDGDDYDAFIGDNGLGVLNIYTNQSTATGLVRTILSGTVGTVDYDTGEVAFTANVKAYTGNYISIYGKLRNKDIYAVQNKFLLVESSDVSVTLIPFVGNN